jgi:hypothetical protein
MKTTVEISDPLLDEAKTVAAREETTVRALIEEGLRRVLAERSKRKTFKLRMVTFRGKGIRRWADAIRGTFLAGGVVQPLRLRCSLGLT